MKLLPLIMLAALGVTGCKPDPDPETTSMARAVEGRSQQVLYAPARFALSTTYHSGIAGFRIEDVPRESLAAIIETTSDRINVSPASAADLTSPVFAQNVLLQLLNRVRADVTALLPLANPAEEAGDWSITPIETGLTHDVYGNLVAYGRYRFEYKPLYRLRSVDVYRYLAAVLLRKRWSGFPKDDKKYYPAGASAVHFSIGVSLHQESGYYTGGQDARRVGLSFAAVPGNKRVDATWEDLDDLVTFKTLGHLRDNLIEDTATFEVTEVGPAADFVIAIDRNGSLVQEAPTVRALIFDFVNKLTVESGYDYHVAIVTQGSTDYVRLTDGTRFISPTSAGPEKLVEAALDNVLASADGSTSVSAELLRTAALAITDPALGGPNKGFRRSGAPLALLYIGDRDDRNGLDGATISSTEQYVAVYQSALRPYDHWFLLAPSRDACKGTNLEAAGGAFRLLATMAEVGGTYHDLCNFSPELLVRDLMTWGETASSVFHFDAPQPFPFTLKVSVAGKSLARDDDAGFTYDVIGDRLVFPRSSEPQPGDKVGARFYRFDVPRAP